MRAFVRHFWAFPLIVVAVAAFLAAPPRAVPWTATPYGKAAIAGDGGGWRITVTSPPGGITLVAPTDPAQIYKLVVSGRPVQGPATLRIRAGEDPPSYATAPDGTSPRIILSGHDRAEVMLYGDAPFDYRIESVSLAPCPDCPTDEKFKARLLREIPGLAALLQTDRLAAAVALDDWAAQTVDAGEDIPKFRKIQADLPAMSASQIDQDIWQADAGGGSCSAFAVFFQKVLALFGYSAFTVDVGYPGTMLTYVTTIVEHEGRFYVIDPTLDATYRDGSGALVDLAAALRGEGKFAQRPIRRSFMYMPGHRALFRQAMAAIDVAEPDCREKDGYEFCPSLPYNAQLVRYGWAGALAEQGIADAPDLFLALLRHRLLSVGVTATAETRARFIETMRAAGVPIGF